MEDHNEFRPPRRIRVFLLEDPNNVVVLRTRDGESCWRHLLPREAMSRAKGAGSCWRWQKLGTGLFGGCAGCAGNSGVGVGLPGLLGYFELKTPSSELSSSSSVEGPGPCAASLIRAGYIKRSRLDIQGEGIGFYLRQECLYGVPAVRKYELTGDSGYLYFLQAAICTGQRMQAELTRAEFEASFDPSTFLSLTIPPETI